MDGTREDVANDPARRMRFLPVGLDVRDKNCLVVGGGNVGTRKVGNLVNAGGAVTVLAPAVTQELAAEVRSGTTKWIKDRFRDEFLEGVFLVVAATDDETLNQNIVIKAAERGVLACDASSAERSQVIFGALHNDESGTTVAVFTDGRDPAEARRTRDRIVRLMGEDLESENRPVSG